MTDATAPRFLARLHSKWREHGFLGLVRRQIHGWRCRLLMNPTWHGLVSKYFALLRGNRIGYRGLTINVNEPSIDAKARALIYHGIYEGEEVELSLKMIDRSLPLVELGGSIGVVACTLNRVLEHPEKHVVVEANPRLIPLLEENRRANGARFEIVPAAIGYGGLTITFTLGDSVSGSIRETAGRKVEVPTVSLRSLIEDRGLGRVNLVMDIEGAEIDLIENELDVMEAYVQCVVMETHDRFVGGGKTDRMLERLEAAGFATELRTDGDVLALVNRRLAPATAESVA